MKIENALTPPNSYLQAYKLRTIALKAGDWFTFEQYRVNPVFEPWDFGFANQFNFYGSDESAILNNIPPRDPGECVLWNTTKKAVIRFHKHPNVVASEFLANYSFGSDLFLPTSVGAVPQPLNAMAKDGDEIEIYGLTEIRKFFCGPLHSTIGSVAHLLTIALFE